MRSETAPMWPTFLVALGIILLACAVMYIATGKIKLSRDNYVRRDEAPQKFWAIIGGCILVSVVALVIGVPRFGPGG